MNSPRGRWVDYCPIGRESWKMREREREKGFSRSRWRRYVKYTEQNRTEQHHKKKKRNNDRRNHTLGLGSSSASFFFSFDILCVFICKRNITNSEARERAHTHTQAIIMTARKSSEKRRGGRLCFHHYKLDAHCSPFVNGQATRQFIII